MNADPQLYIAALCRIGETCERLHKEGASTALIVTGLLSVATAFASVSFVDDPASSKDAAPPDDHRTSEEPRRRRNFS